MAMGFACCLLCAFVVAWGGGFLLFTGLWPRWSDRQAAWGFLGGVASLAVLVGAGFAFEARASRRYGYLVGYPIGAVLALGALALALWWTSLRLRGA